MDEMIIGSVGWNTRLVTNPDFILREIGEESILVPIVESGPFQNTMLTMNETAAYLWRHFSEGCTPAELRDLALQEYEAENGDPNVITEGIYSFVFESVANGTLLPEEAAHESD